MHLIGRLEWKRSKRLSVSIPVDDDSGSTRGPKRSPSKALVVVLLTALVGIGCATPTPTGPLFGGPSPAEDGTARVYFYRVDKHHSFSTVEIRFDGEKPIPILDEEYASIDLEDGIHEVEFRLRNAIWGGWRWRKQVLRASPGETIYMEIAVGVDEQELASGGDLAIPGRDSGTAGEHVTLRLRER